MQPLDGEEGKVLTKMLGLFKMIFTGGRYDY